MNHKTSQQTKRNIVIIICIVMLVIGSNVTLVSAEINYSNPSTTNLVAWWSLNENSGTRYDNHSTNHLGEYNGVTSGSGKQGNASLFDNNNNQSLYVTDNDEISMGDIDFTVGGWVNIETLNGLRALVGKGPNNGANVGYEYIIEYDNIPNQFWFSVGNGTTYGSHTFYKYLVFHRSMA